jgi:hypothetical protein
MNDKIVDGFMWQMDACRSLGSPLTADVLAGVLAALDRTTRTGTRILDWTGDPRLDALTLRIAGGLNALARSGKDERLTALYTARGGDWESELRRVFAEWDDWLTPWLNHAPQTNEVARSGVLYPGMMEVARRFGPKLELLELGASAGLNLNLDRFCYDLGGCKAGDPVSAVKIAPQWAGASIAPCPVEVISKAGVDLNPLDATKDEVANTMLAYIWPDQEERLARAAAAIKLASEYPVHVDAADGAQWLEQKLLEPQASGTTRLIYHSIALQYFPADGKARVKTAIKSAGAAATKEHPLAWLAMEFPAMTEKVELSLRCWPGNGERELLGFCHPHGAWVEWLG